MTADCTILMLNSGRRVEVLRAFRAAFAAMRVAGRIVCTDINGLAPTLYMTDAKYRLPRSIEAEFGDRLVEVSIREEVSLVVPFIDPDLPALASLQPRLLQQGVGALISPAEAIAICRDKVRTHDFLKSRGFPTPDVLSLEEARRHDFPMFVKPRAGSASMNAFQVTLLKELEFFADYVPDAIVQEFVRGEEFTVDVFSDWAGQPIAAIPRGARVRAGEVLVGCIERHATLEEQCKQIARELWRRWDRSTCKRSSRTVVSGLPRSTRDLAAVVR